MSLCKNGHDPDKTKPMNTGVVPRYPCKNCGVYIPDFKLRVLTEAQKMNIKLRLDSRIPKFDDKLDILHVKYFFIMMVILLGMLIILVIKP